MSPAAWCHPHVFVILSLLTTTTTTTRAYHGGHARLFSPQSNSLTTSADPARIVDHVDRSHHRLNNNARHTDFWSSRQRPIDTVLGLKAEIRGNREWEERDALDGGVWDDVQEEVRDCDVKQRRKQRSGLWGYNIFAYVNILFATDDLYPL